MERSSIIATVVAAGGILIAGSVASAAVINATATSQPDGTTAQIVATSATAEPFIETADTSTSVELPEFSADDLPEIVVPEVDIPDVNADTANAAPQVAAASPRSTPKPTATPTTKPTPKPTAAKASAPASSATPEATAPSARSISADKAVSVVLNATNGGVVQSAQSTTHDGFDSWAITVKRADGSVVIGYVDRATGVAFDWVVKQQAPTPTPTPSQSSGYDDDHDDDDDHGDDDDHDDDHGDDDHGDEGDDDDD
ncbi:MAG: hypothetical protein K9G80_07615 [Candidatus Nanopelagicales bacterium]|nr:hypothetical protein [Candidatus Nanopelagicales bacterium]MCF8537152.1 hypothetical protein [Candidatus Nanopelagicales bacterium]MCF8556453.1 hypothetical protein [Candidatus Nanopelagicales bacterium]